MTFLQDSSKNTWQEMVYLQHGFGPSVVQQWVDFGEGCCLFFIIFKNYNCIIYPFPFLPLALTLPPAFSQIYLEIYVYAHTYIFLNIQIQPSQSIMFPACI